MNPENTFFSVKRFIGRRMSEVGSESTQVPYRVRRRGSQRPRSPVILEGMGGFNGRRSRADACARVWAYPCGSVPRGLSCEQGRASHSCSVEDLIDVPAHSMTVRGLRVVDVDGCHSPAVLLRKTPSFLTRILPHLTLIR